MDLNTPSYLILSAIVLTELGLTAKAEAADWRIALGAHNTNVEQAD